MKLLCYGASVTAQKDKGGYFYHLERLYAPCEEVEIERLSYGASHFDYAGYAYAECLVKAKPDVCIVDWLTPSMKVFSEEKIKRFNLHLLKNGVFPVWVHFPRADDLKGQRECYKQVVDCCNLLAIPFIDMCEHLRDIVVEPSKYLRDVVHTNSFGAREYAKVLYHRLNELDFDSLDCWAYAESENYPRLPKVISVDDYVSLDHSFSFSFEVLSERALEVLALSSIGPSMCNLKVQLVKEGKSLAELDVRPADPWCYYSRVMVLPPWKFQVSSGQYTLVVSYLDGDPLEGIQLRGDVGEGAVLNAADRAMYIEQISINADRFFVLT
ncbi:hypothetical protein [Reinekea marinisedimentorum]|uniref:Uncharacterized protein n=1 Tax=Reinekea marinisedimentorum TaxID=230495 RepID=A0A4R3I7E7_9GAMM|nr:hypothetical protein [Reinekea marinisedimentorum]TCS41947.1 hypothetical protein BCF53_10451 [Reinekea marinisedimentorum]